MQELCCLGAMMQRWAPPTRYTLQRNTARKMKGLVFCFIEISFFLSTLMLFAE